MPVAFVVVGRPTVGRRNRVELEWGRDGHGDAVGPDGTVYRIFSEHTRGEPRVYNVMMLPPGDANEQGTPAEGKKWQHLPKGDESKSPSTQKTRARRHAESLLPEEAS